MPWPRLGATLALLSACSAYLCWSQTSPDDVYWDTRIGFPGLRGPTPTVNGWVRAIAIENNRVYAGGSFTSAGSVTAQGIAVWDGSNWAAVAGGVDVSTTGTVLAMISHGGSLYIGGIGIRHVYYPDGTSLPVFGGVVAWNGTTWSYLGGVAQVYAFGVGGEYIYAGGTGVGRWDGTNWSAMNGGVSGTVYAISVNGSDVFVGGEFSSASSVPGTANIARWDGTNWWSVGGGLPGPVYALASRGNEIFAGGAFSSNGLAHFSVSGWEFMPGVNPAGSVIKNMTLNDKTLFVSGERGLFKMGARCAGLWDTQPLGSGIQGEITALATSGHDLYVGGRSLIAGGRGFRGMVRWSAADMPTVTIENVRTNVSGNNTTLWFTVAVCPLPETPLVLQYASSNGTAQAIIDYTAVSGSLTFSTNTPARQMIGVPVNAKPYYFGEKSFTVQLRTTNILLATSQLSAEGQLATIFPAPTLSITNAVGPEGALGTNSLEFTVAVSAPLAEHLTVSLQYNSDTAFAYLDYLPVPTTVTIPFGAPSQEFIVPVLGNGFKEVDKKFQVSLVANSANLALSRGQAQGTILNDDELPGILAQSYVQNEGDEFHLVQAELRLSVPPAAEVTVDFSTSDGTAIAGRDYLSVSGQVVFPPGVTTQSISVPIFGDSYVTPDKTFLINLSNSVNAALTVTQVVWTVLNDDVISVQPGFAVSPLASNLSNPTRMEFSPDGRLFVLEQNGRIWVIRDGTRLPEPFLTLSVWARQETGLLGIAFDPGFVTNQFFYLYYTAQGPSNRVSRFTAAGDLGLRESEVILADLEIVDSTIHNGGDIHFGPDGMLYVAVGDRGNAPNSQSISNRLGKILRLKPDGTIPPDNPFYQQATDANRAIWILGLRNPYTFAFDSMGDRVFINDVGPDRWEEINESRGNSANYGWPFVEGIGTNPTYVNPIFAYKHPPYATSTNEITGCAITGGVFYNPTNPRFGSSYIGNYFFADFCKGWIHRLIFTNGVSVVNFASGIPSVVDLKVGPDGHLYCLCYDYFDRYGRRGGLVFRFSAPAFPGRFEQITRMTNNSVSLLLSADPGYPYWLETSSNLFDWKRLTNVLPRTNVFTIQDPAAPQTRERFYRLTQ